MRIVDMVAPHLGATAARDIGGVDRNELSAECAALSIPKLGDCCKGRFDWDRLTTARHGNMPRKKPKLALLADQIATARRIVEAQQALLERLRVNGQPTYEAEAALRTYVSSLMHHLAHADKLRDEALAKKAETKKEH